MDITYGSICLQLKSAVNIADMLAMPVVRRVAILQVPSHDDLVPFSVLSAGFPNQPRLPSSLLDHDVNMRHPALHVKMC